MPLGSPRFSSLPLRLGRFAAVSPRPQETPCSVRRHVDLGPLTLWPPHRACRAEARSARGPVLEATQQDSALTHFMWVSPFPVEKEMAPHSSVLAWRVPGTGEPGGYGLWGRTESDTTEATQQQQQQQQQQHAFQQSWQVQGILRASLPVLQGGLQLMPAMTFNYH